MSNNKYKFETLQLHAGQESPDSATGARAVPIYASSSYVFNNSQHAADRFALRDAGNIYGRLTNPTQDVFEQRIAALEGGVAALAVASGAAAISYTIQNLASAGDHIVASKTIYGGTYNLLAHTLPQYGITTTFVDPDEENAFENAKNLKSVYLPKSVTEFEPKDIDGITVYMYEDTELYKTLSESKNVTEDTEVPSESKEAEEETVPAPESQEIKYEIKTIPDSYYVHLYSSTIPFSYDHISDKTIDITMYSAHQSTVIIPESIDGKIVTSISLDVFEDGIDTLVIPSTVTNIEKDLYHGRYDVRFVIGLLIALVGTIFAIIIVLTLKVSSKEKMFLRVSQFRTAYILTILSTILAGLYMFVYAIPEWFILALFVIVCGVSALSVVKAKTAVALVEGVDEKIKVQTQVFKTL